MEDNDKLDRGGVLWSFISAFLWSTVFVCARDMLGRKSIDPVSLTAIRFLIGGTILLVLGFYLRKGKMLSLSAKQYFTLFGLAFFGVVGMSVFLFFGQQTSTAINAAMIMQLNPIIIMIFGLFIGERICLGIIGSNFLSLVGCLIVLEVITTKGLKFQTGHLKGDILVFCAATSWAVYSILGKKVLQKIDGYIATTWIMIFGGIETLALLFILPGEPTLPSETEDWMKILYLAIFPTAMAFFAWYEAMARIPLAVLNVMQYLTPPMTIALAYFLLDEKLTTAKLIGALMVLIGVIFTEISRARMLRAKTPFQPQ
jgi:drug/metabolite transporter (DMT)-like permease